MKNLELMGVQEMDAVEMRNIDGGEMLPALKSDAGGSYWEWPGGSWVAIDWLA
jgi:hypothetical protein